MVEMHQLLHQFVVLCLQIYLSVSLPGETIKDSKIIKRLIPNDFKMIVMIIETFDHFRYCFSNYLLNLLT